MLKSGGSILDANPGSDLDAIQQSGLADHLRHVQGGGQRHGDARHHFAGKAWGQEREFCEPLINRESYKTSDPHCIAGTTVGAAKNRGHLIFCLICYPV